MTDYLYPNVPIDSESLHDYFNRCYWSRKIGRSTRTKVLYLHTIKHFSLHLGRVALVSDLNDDAVCSFIQARHAATSCHTASRDRTNLMAIATFAAKKRHIPEFLDVPTVPLVYPMPTAYRPEQFAQLMTACRTAPGLVGKVAAADWWTAFNVVALTTGERTEALLSLHWEWLTPDGWLRVPANVRKGGRKAMTYRLSPATLMLVDRLRTNGAELIFATHWKCVESFYWNYTKLLKRAGLPSGRRWKPQMLRRTFASYLKLAGGNATDALAHDSSSTTRRHYEDPTVTDKPAPGDDVARYFGLA
jgi:integrase